MASKGTKLVGLALGDEPEGVWTCTLDADEPFEPVVLGPAGDVAKGKGKDAPIVCCGASGDGELGSASKNTANTELGQPADLGVMTRTFDSDITAASWEKQLHLDPASQPSTIAEESERGARGQSEIAIERTHHRVGRAVPGMVTFGNGLPLFVTGLAYSAWLLGSSSMTCEGEATRSPFWSYVLFYNGVWFWLSLTSMASLFELALSRSATSDWLTASKVLCRAGLCTAVGLACGSFGLYLWHIEGDRLDGDLFTKLISKAIVMACVGLFGVAMAGLLTIPFSYKAATNYKSFIRYLLFQGLCPVILCCVWCMVWLVAEIFTQCFGAFSQAIQGRLPLVLVAMLESMYIEFFSVVILPTIRLMLGPVERFFLSRGGRGPGVEGLASALRAITWIDMLFDGFRWIYNRVIFAKVRPETLALMLLHHMAVSLYTYQWKYSPFRITNRIEFFICPDCVAPSLMARMVVKHPSLMKLVVVVTQFGRLFDLFSGALFSSTYFELSLAKTDPSISYTGRKKCARKDRRCVASLTILNHRVLVLVPVLDGYPADLDASAPQELTELRALCRISMQHMSSEEMAEEAARKTQDMARCKSELALAHTVALGLLQHVENRLSARQCMRLLSSLLLLLSNMILAATDTRTVRDPTGSLPDNFARLLVFPLAMMLSDAVDVFCMHHAMSGWIFSHETVRRWRQALVGDPLFVLAQCCLMIHVAMSSMLNRHSVALCP